ncbi:MAG TPA: antibiotic biosynthesis monooxygenase family protein [Methylomirabilota bacterium]|nr:antibiotic biosynthesis monooxygenase family protein [Methylomirabilota bacterium]
MVTIVTGIELKQGREEEWDAAMQERMSAVRDQPGWVGGQMLRPEGEPARRLIVGTWQTQDDWKRWHDDPEFASTRDELDDLTEGTEQHEWYGVVLDVRPSKQTRGASSKRSSARSGRSGKQT